MNRIVLFLIPPLFSAALLGGILVEKSRHVTPEHTDAYHERCREALDPETGIVPIRIDPSWVRVEDTELHPAAVKLLRPNATINRVYRDTRTTGFYRTNVTLMIVQCRDTRDMAGHFPPICYPSNGYTSIAGTDDRPGEERDWYINGMHIPGVEYRYATTRRGITERQAICNFMIVPGKGIVRDMDGVRKAAEDYQQRYYGAAQVWVVMDANLPVEQRNEIFEQIMTPNIPVLETLLSEGISP